jgi:hypothetical protein
MEFLDGKKTYVVAALAALATAAHLVFPELLTVDVWTGVMGLLGAGGLAALRAGVEKK